MKTIRILTIGVSALLLTACGGSDSDSGSGDAVEVDGVYTGNQKVTTEFSSGGTSSFIDEAKMRITVKDGRVKVEVIKDISTGEDNVDLMGRSFTAVIGTRFSGAKNTKCEGSNTYKGTISGTKITGSVSGLSDCTDDQGPYQQIHSGTFTTVRY